MTTEVKHMIYILASQHSNILHVMWCIDFLKFCIKNCLWQSYLCLVPAKDIATSHFKSSSWPSKTNCKIGYSSAVKEMGSI